MLSFVLDPALWAGRDKYVGASRDERTELLCNVCAKPPVDNLAWQFNGRPLRGGIVQNVSSFMYKFVNEKGSAARLAIV